MLKKRIIPCLDIKNGRTVKGVNFVDIRDAGDPVVLAKQYAEQGADELVFLDITATIEARETLISLVADIAANINIPFTVGGGITTVAQAKALIRAGADKISVNSAAVKRPELVQELAAEFGSQCVVVAVDTKCEDDQWTVFVSGGRTPTGIDTLAWVEKMEALGAGEILLTSMNNDGTKAGFALDITSAVAEKVQIPVIASGGAGTIAHFETLFKQTTASAGLAASIFHYGEIPVPQLKSALKDKNIPIR